jgi:protein SCO1/2
MIRTTAVVAATLVAAGVLAGTVRAQAVTPRSIDDLAIPLEDDSGAPARIDAWRGRHVAVAMGYTTCQRICPLFTLKILRDLEARYRDVVPPLELVFVTLDPKTDTPHALAAYRERQGLTSPHWHLLTGRRADLEHVARALGVTYVDVESHVRHDLKIVLFAPTGEVARVFDWEHREVN